MNTKILSVVALLNAFALSAQAAVVFSATDFSLADPNGADQKGSFTDGVDLQNRIYLWGLQSSTPATGGNPDSWLSMADWNSIAWVATSVSPAGDTMTFSIDYRTAGGPWGSQFDIIGVPTGATVSDLGGVYSNPTGGTVLYDGSLGDTASQWLNKSQEVIVPAGYSSVIFRFGLDHNPSAIRGFDNISIVSAIPEPGAYAALFGALLTGLTVYRSKRKNTK